jgi:hypothetical protein
MDEQNRKLLSGCNLERKTATVNKDRSENAGVARFCGFSKRT